MKCVHYVFLLLFLCPFVLKSRGIQKFYALEIWLSNFAEETNDNKKEFDIKKTFLKHMLSGSNSNADDGVADSEANNGVLPEMCEQPIGTFSALSESNSRLKMTEIFPEPCSSTVAAPGCLDVDQDGPVFETFAHLHATKTSWKSRHYQLNIPETYREYANYVGQKPILLAQDDAANPSSVVGLFGSVQHTATFFPKPPTSANYFSQNLQLATDKRIRLEVRNAISAPVSPQDFSAQPVPFCVATTGLVSDHNLVHQMSGEHANPHHLLI